MVIANEGRGGPLLDRHALPVHGHMAWNSELKKYCSEPMQMLTDKDQTTAIIASRRIIYEEAYYYGKPNVAYADLVMRIRPISNAGTAYLARPTDR